ncbi:PulJ/GspJ family protein [Oligoflexus tunisiensis]|uniref:PulJ/GspJ family protein n=1 Tax=Oligoflexus tunisiensis TaxID=708132 RepID=UPI00114CCE35|nr:prepilin-type N-terminal cleavage/methylation domain-containing protein [Oligoflexus tunisiensis]
MKKPQNRPEDNHEAGFSLISVLIAVALISLIVMFASRALVVTKKAKVSVKAGEGYQQIIAVLDDSLKTFIKTNITSASVPCGDPASFFASQSFLRLYTSNRSSALAAVPSGVNSGAWNNLFSRELAANSFAGSSLNRCPRVERGANGRFHFCLNILRDTSQPQESLLSSPLAFVEIAIQLNDLQSGNVINCAEYLDPNRSSAGASVDYILFWAHANGTELDLKKRSGSLYVNK